MQIYRNNGAKPHKENNQQKLMDICRLIEDLVGNGGLKLGREPIFPDFRSS